MHGCEGGFFSLFTHCKIIYFPLVPDWSNKISGCSHNDTCRHFLILIRSVRVEFRQLKLLYISWCFREILKIPSTLTSTSPHHTCMHWILDQGLVSKHFCVFQAAFQGAQRTFSQRSQQWMQKQPPHVKLCTWIILCCEAQTFCCRNKGKKTCFDRKER